MSTVQVWKRLYTDILSHRTDVLLTGSLQMFAVGKNSGSGITVDQSGAVLDKWSPPHVVSDHVLPLVTNWISCSIFYIEVP